MADRPGDPTRTTAQQAGDAAETLVASRLAEAGFFFFFLTRRVLEFRYLFAQFIASPALWY
jgi:hypothetical protein